MKKATAVLLIILLLIVTLTGCSSSNSNFNSVNNASSSAGETKNDAVGNSNSNDVNYGSSGQQDKRKIEKSAVVTVETLTYDTTNATLEALTVQYGGYVESSTVDGQSLNDSKHSRTAEYVLRIPQEKLDAFLGGAFTTGTVTQKTVTGVDVSQQYYDTQARLSALQIQQNNLMDMLKKATNTEDMIKINQSLTDVITQIEQLTSKLQQIDSLVSMSTVKVTVVEVTDSTRTNAAGFGTQLWNTFRGSLNAFIEYCKIMVLVIVAILPFAIFFGLIAIAVIFILKFRNNKKKKNRPELPQMKYPQQLPPQNVVQDDGDNKPKKD